MNLFIKDKQILRENKRVFSQVKIGMVERATQFLDRVGKKKL